MGNNNSGVITLGIIGFICIAVWWIQTSFGVTTAGYVLMGLGIALAIVLGFVLNMASTKNVMANLVEFNKHDAQTDRYRMMAYRENAKGQAAWEKAQAQLTVINEKRVHQIADQKAKLLMDAQQPQQQQADWDWQESDIDADWNVME